MKRQSTEEEKCLQVMHKSDKDVYLEYIKNSYNSIIRRLTYKMSKAPERTFLQRR